MHCKQHLPDGTSAGILVPGCLRSVLKPLRSGMRLLKRFTKGAAIWKQSSRSGRSYASPGINWPVDIHADAPTAVGKVFADGRPLHGVRGAAVAAAANCPDLSPDGRLSMLFEGSFRRADGGRVTAPKPSLNLSMYLLSWLTLTDWWRRGASASVPHI